VHPVRLSCEDVRTLGVVPAGGGAFEGISSGRAMFHEQRQFGAGSAFQARGRVASGFS
jgi:hypothetical protein